MLDVIQNNPYRVLGVYSNSPKKDIVANKGKMTAFLKVGREVSFPLDFNGVLPSLVRNVDIVAKAEGDLSLAENQIRYGQFWFIKVNSIDDIGFNHLLNNNITSALDVWSKKECMSSLQNSLMCYLIMNDYQNAISCAERLYENYSEQFVVSIAGSTIKIVEDDLIDNFCNVVFANQDIDYLSIFNGVANESWKNTLSAQLVSPLIQQIESAVNEAKQVDRENASANYLAAVRLANTTKPLLSNLKKLLSINDVQYQMIADKLGLQILQCGINYYNNSEDDDSASKAMKLQKFAQSIVVGSMAKSRCEENTKILQDVIDQLPPQEVIGEYKAVLEKLKVFKNQPDRISYAIELLNSTKPYLDKIKSKLGATDSKYLQLSTTIIGNALHNLIEEVNGVQEHFDIYIRLDKESTLNRIRSVLQEAWRAIKLMDAFDMESDFKINRYILQRKSLEGLCNQLGVTTNIIPSVHRRPVSPPPSTPFVEKSDTNLGCLWTIIIYFIIAIIIGAICDSTGGDFAVGFFISFFITGGIYSIFFEKR